MYIKAGIAIEDILRIRFHCYDVLVTLLEYDQNLLDVGEKVAPSLRYVVIIDNSTVIRAGGQLYMFLLYNYS